VSGSSLDLDGLVKKAKGGVRFVYADEAQAHIDSTTPIIDVALALARAGRDLARTAEILDASGRTEDEHLWSAIAELGRRFTEADRDGDVWTWLTRNRRALQSEAGRLEISREQRSREERERGDQRSIFDREEDG